MILLKNHYMKFIKINPCLSPVNSLSYHISRGVPAITEDWIKIWNDNFINLKIKFYPAITASNNKATIFVILIIGLTAGPAVSL